MSIQEKLEPEAAEASAMINKIISVRPGALDQITVIAPVIGSIAISLKRIADNLDHIEMNTRRNT